MVWHACPLVSIPIYHVMTGIIIEICTRLPKSQQPILNLQKRCRSEYHWPPLKLASQPAERCRFSSVLFLSETKLSAQSSVILAQVFHPFYRNIHFFNASFYSFCVLPVVNLVATFRVSTNSASMLLSVAFLIVCDLLQCACISEAVNLLC